MKRKFMFSARAIAAFSIAVMILQCFVSCKELERDVEKSPDIEIVAQHSSFKDAQFSYEIKVKGKDDGIAAINYMVKLVSTAGDTQFIPGKEFIARPSESASEISLLDSLSIDDYFSHIDIVVMAADSSGHRSQRVHRIYPFSRIMDLQHSHFNPAGPTYKIIDNNDELQRLWKQCEVDYTLPAVDFNTDMVLFYADHRSRACDCYLRVEEFSTGSDGAFINVKTVVQDASPECETWCEERFSPVLLLQIDKRYVEHGIRVAGATEIICADSVRVEEVAARSL